MHEIDYCRFCCRGCPACKLPMHYAPTNDDHACSDPRCQLARGVAAMNAVSRCARRLADNIDEFDFVTDSEIVGALEDAIAAVEPARENGSPDAR